MIEMILLATGAVIWIIGIIIGIFFIPLVILLIVGMIAKDMDTYLNYRCANLAEWYVRNILEPIGKKFQII